MQITVTISKKRVRNEKQSIMSELTVFGTGEYREKAERLAERLGASFVDEMTGTEEIALAVGERGISLVGDGMELRADLTEMLPRLKQANLEREMLVKAARIKGRQNLRIIDATAGFGEDSILLAAAGHDVTMFEYNPVIYELLKDAIERASEDERLKTIVSRMHLINGDSAEAMKRAKEKGEEFDAILLDPMFPERQKSASVKKKFQLLHKLEAPCSAEEELLEAALGLKPKKVIVKRPGKGEFLAGRKPDYSLEGKAIRYDCIIGNTK